jgi:hypothetical protein
VYRELSGGHGEARRWLSWQGTNLGVREVPREVGELELQAFFTFSRTEHAIIQRRRGPALKLGLALHMGFVRMSGRPLDAFRVLPVVRSSLAALDGENLAWPLERGKPLTVQRP